MVSGGGGGDISVLCEERRILEMVSNILRLYVGVESEQAQLVQCTLLENCRQAGGAAVCSLPSAGRAVRHAAASYFAEEGAGEGAGAA